MLRITHCLAKTTAHSKYFCTTMRPKFVTQLDIVEININLVLGIVKCHVYSFTIFVGCFYFTLGNMSPQLRSSVKAIQLVALAKTSHISQYGISPVLQCITDDILQLEKVNMSGCLL